MLPLLASIILFLLLWLVLNMGEPVFRGILPRLAKLTTKYRYGDYLPVVLLLAVGAALAALAAMSSSISPSSSCRRVPCFRTSTRQFTTCLFTRARLVTQRSSLSCR